MPAAATRMATAPTCEIRLKRMSSSPELEFDDAAGQRRPPNRALSAAAAAVTAKLGRLPGVFNGRSDIGLRRLRPDHLSSTTRVFTARFSLMSTGGLSTT